MSRGKKKLSDDPFFFKVSDSIRFHRDAFNLILREINVSESGAQYSLALAFFTSIEFGHRWLEEELGGGSTRITAEQLQRFKERTKDITTHYKNGRLIVSYPKDMTFDVHDLPVTVQSATPKE